MKKFLILLAAAALALGVSAQSIPAKADETQTAHIRTATVTAGGLAPFAWYKFDDEATLGKDLMGNFDLVKKQSGTGSVVVKEDTDGSKYAAFRRKDDVPSYEEGTVTPTSQGVVFYAPQLDKSGYDFSDIIKNSYTVSITFRAPYHPDDYGSNYVLSVGRYNDAVSIVPWRSGVEIQPNTRFVMGRDASQEVIDNAKRVVSCDRKNWVNVTLVGDNENNKVHAYINGELGDSFDVDPVHLSNQNMDGALGADYTFTIGGQCAIGGSGMEGQADADIKECKVFDYAISAENVKALYDETSTSYAGKTIASVPQLDVSAVDFQLTDQNTISHVLGKMNGKATVTLSDGTKESAEIFWTSLGTPSTVYGFLSSHAANTKGFVYEYKCDTVVKFVYDKTAVTISDLKIGGRAGDPDQVNILTEAEAIKPLSVNFKLEVKEGCTIDGVIYDDTDEFLESDWKAEDGYIYLTTRFGAEITIISTGGQGSRPTDSGGDSSQTHSGGSAGGSQGEGQKPGRKGCGSSISVSLLSVGALAGAVALIYKRRADK